MNWKTPLKRCLPKWAHYLYNRVVSRRLIQEQLGDWFEVDWKQRAFRADDRTWRETYDRSWEHWQQPDLSALDVEQIKVLIPPAGSILDAGCGDGFLIQALSGPACRLTGADLSAVGLQLARRRLGSHAALVEASLENLPFKSRAFDVVITAHTLEHVRDLLAVIGELKRVAAKRLIILVPVQEYLPYTQDYHLHFFATENDLLRQVGIPGACCQRYQVPPGPWAFQGEVLLLVADIETNG
jgi:SAM-dependent methyltransferase